MSKVIKWINKSIINKGNDKINSEDIEQVRDFTLLWNLFEDIFCDKFCKTDKIISLLSKNRIEVLEQNTINSKINSIFDYFMDRYKDNEKLEKLNFNKKNHERDIKNKIQNKEVINLDFEEKIQIILFIIYRYRNNLFHGEKDMRYISYQNENFENANDFLMLFIENCKSV